ncbi:MAG: response regulator, partial [Anaerolineae bacterium]|nr:response regulator [Anaerolineae bacterium]
MATVLVVDDDERLLKMLQRTLTYEGFRVLTAVDGTSALAQVQTYHPDVIVLDWMMPGLDGIQVVKHLRAQSDPTLILILTARDAIED